MIKIQRFSLADVEQEECHHGSVLNGPYNFISISFFFVLHSDVCFCFIELLVECHDNFYPPYYINTASMYLLFNGAPSLLPLLWMAGRPFD